MRELTRLLPATHSQNTSSLFNVLHKMTIEPTFEKFYKSGAFTCARSHAPPPCHTYSKHQLSLHAHLSKNDPSDFSEILPYTTGTSMTLAREIKVFWTKKWQGEYWEWGIYAQKSSVYTQKSHSQIQKSPVYTQKSPLYLNRAQGEMTRWILGMMIFVFWQMRKKNEANTGMRIFFTFPPQVPLSTSPSHPLYSHRPSEV